MWAEETSDTLHRHDRALLSTTTFLSFLGENNLGTVRSDDVKFKINTWSSCAGLGVGSVPERISWFTQRSFDAISKFSLNTLLYASFSTRRYYHLGNKFTRRDKLSSIVWLTIPSWYQDVYQSRSGSVQFRRSSPVEDNNNWIHDLRQRGVVDCRIIQSLVSCSGSIAVTRHIWWTFGNTLFTRQDVSRASREF